MAAIASTRAHSSSRDSFSISKFIFRLRSKSFRDESRETRDPRPPLRTSPLPLVLSAHQPTLSQLGWTTITFPSSHAKSEGQSSSILGAHPLKQACEELFEASKAFFNLPDSEKEKWRTKLGSEEGWSKISGEKEFITLRCLDYTPDILKPAATRYWSASGQYLDNALGRIAGGLGMDDGEGAGLRRYVGPCKTLQEKDEQKTATMLRLFRYEGNEAKVVAEPHADLGLLSMVVGNTPGLEVWNGHAWIPIEQTYTTPSATLLAGRQLEMLSNFRYPAGGHRVVSYGAPLKHANNDGPNYRFSIVFVLRAHEDIVVNTDSLTTDVTGSFGEKRIEGITAGQMFEKIRSAHFNINTNMAERNEQRRKLMASRTERSRNIGH